MAVRLESTIKRFIGSSTDQKPRLGDPGIDKATDLPAGSSFLEEDTGQVFRWTGAVWAVAVKDDRVEVLLTTILRQQRADPPLLQGDSGSPSGRADHHP